MAQTFEDLLALSGHRSLRSRRRAAAGIVQVLSTPRGSPDEREQLVEALLDLLGDPRPGVHGAALAAVEGSGAFLDDKVGGALVGRLATLGADPDLPQANDALRVLKVVERRMGRAPTPFARRVGAGPRDPLK